MMRFVRWLRFIAEYPTPLDAATHRAIARYHLRQADAAERPKNAPPPSRGPLFAEELRQSYREGRP